MIAKLHPDPHQFRRFFSRIGVGPEERVPLEVKLLRDGPAIRARFIEAVERGERGAVEALQGLLECELGVR